MAFKFQVLVLTALVVFFSYSEAFASCSFLSAKVKGSVTQLVKVESENRCIAHLRFSDYSPNRRCGLAPEMVELYGLPVDCKTKLGQSLSGIIKYHPVDGDIEFNNFWMTIPSLDLVPSPYWPFGE